MEYLFFTNTPAHVHMYKHVADELLSEGRSVRVLARDYGCTLSLLEAADLPYEVYGECDTSKGSLLRELPRHYLGIARRVRSADDPMVFGMGAYAAHASVLARASSTVLVLDSEPTSLDHAVSRPFADAILTPHAFQKDLGANHYRFRGFKESAYLHPDVFEPDPSVRDELGVGPDEPFVVCRFNAFGSHHDVAEGGFSRAQRRELIETLSERATVFVSDEGGDLDVGATPGREFDLHPARLHDALSEAALLVADTQTIVTEAALLGTPAIRSNSFVGDDDMGNFRELERAGLVYNVEEFQEVLDRATALLSDPDAGREHRQRRDEYVEGTTNLTELLLSIARARDPSVAADLDRSERRVLDPA